VDVDSLLILPASPIEMGIDHIGKGTNQVETEALKALPLKLGIVEPQQWIGGGRRHAGILTDRSGRRR
jgi:hypothetical protein